MVQDTIYASMIAVSNRHLCNASNAPTDKSDTEKYIEQLKKIATHSPKAILLREKDLTEGDYEILVKEVLEELGTSSVPMILHTYIDVALLLKQTKIHLPLPLLKELSQSLEGQMKLSCFTEIGTSIHSLEDMLLAKELGATYVLAGNVYETDCKKGLPGRGLEFIKAVSSANELPVYALGGINETNASECMSLGAAGFAMMSGAMKLS